ncbi:MAG: nitroreductase family protein, partial [Pseudomonadota bacterium]
MKSILEIAARAPDHRRVAPYRFIVFQGEARGKAGEILADAFAAQEPEADTARLEKERARFERAPVVIGVVSCVDREHRTPEWEQVMTV